MLNIGKMSHRITIIKLELGEDEGFGGAPTWTETATVWAEFLQQRVTVNTDAGSGQAVIVTQGMRIRPCEIEKDWKVREGTHTYDVLDVDRSNSGYYTLTTRLVER